MRAMIAPTKNVEKAVENVVSGNKAWVGGGGRNLRLVRQGDEVIKDGEIAVKRAPTMTDLHCRRK